MKDFPKHIHAMSGDFFIGINLKLSEEYELSFMVHKSVVQVD